jgi:hypothetical protein
MWRWGISQWYLKQLQGVQIGGIFAIWVVAYFGHFFRKNTFKIYLLKNELLKLRYLAKNGLGNILGKKWVGQHFGQNMGWATFWGKMGWATFWAKYGLGNILGHFSSNSSGHTKQLPLYNFLSFF